MKAREAEEYELSQNQVFLNWLYVLAKNGYQNKLTVEEMQGIINGIVAWYELKYPNNYFDYYFQKTNVYHLTNNNARNIDDLMQCFNDRQQDIIDVEYRSDGKGFVDKNEAITLDIYKRDDNTRLRVIANAKTGEVYRTFDIDKILGEAIVDLDGLKY